MPEDSYSASQQHADSSSTLPPPARQRFGDWVFDAASGELSDGATSTRLEPQVARLLDYFLAHQNQLVSRDALIGAVWQGRIVSDDAVNRCVSILRQCLTPDDKQAYIETVTRRGYVAHFPAPPAASPSPAHPSNPAAAPLAPVHRYWVLAAVAGVLMLLAFFLAAGPSDAPREVGTLKTFDLPMVAVLPFASAGGSEDAAFFATGVHNDLLTRLARLQSLRVISSTSVLQYRDGARNLRVIGEELGADAILEGSVQIAAGQIRINAQLIDARTDAHLWAETYSRELTLANVFDVQSEIARAISSALRATLTAQDDRQLELVPTDDMAAYRAYHRAMQYWDSPTISISDPGYRQALEEAVTLDPGFGRAWAELVSVLAYLSFSSADTQMTERAEQALRQLEAVAPDSADHRFAQAAYMYYALQDYDRAHDIMSGALALSPSHLRALELRSFIERRQGDFDARLATTRLMHRLDPRNRRFFDQLIAALMVTHRYDEAAAQLERAAQRKRSFGTDYHRSVLLLRADRDVAGFQRRLAQACRTYDRPACGWIGHVANRDYPAALAMLPLTTSAPRDEGLSLDDRRRIFSYWLMPGTDIPGEELALWQRKLDEQSGEGGDLYGHSLSLGAALLAGVRGDNEVAQRLIERFFRLDPVDWAWRATRRHEACRVLGMIAATRDAIACIREGLEEASYVAPFLEPHLPFYDKIRIEPEFVQMLDEIGATDTVVAKH